MRLLEESRPSDPKWIGPRADRTAHGPTHLGVGRPSNSWVLLIVLGFLWCGWLVGLDFLSVDIIRNLLGYWFVNPNHYPFMKTTNGSNPISIMTVSDPVVIVYWIQSNNHNPSYIYAVMITSKRSSWIDYRSRSGTPRILLLTAPTENSISVISWRTILTQLVSNDSTIECSLISETEDAFASPSLICVVMNVLLHHNIRKRTRDQSANPYDYL